MDIREQIEKLKEQDKKDRACECEQCGHKWTRKPCNPHPYMCPSCKSRNWNKNKL